MKKTDIGVVAFMYAVCAFFYAYSSKLTAESKTYPMFTIALRFAQTTLYHSQLILSAPKFGVERGVPMLISVVAMNLLIYFAFVKFLGVKLPSGLLF